VHMTSPEFEPQFPTRSAATVYEWVTVGAKVLQRSRPQRTKSGISQTSQEPNQARHIAANNPVITLRHAGQYGSTIATVQPMYPSAHFGFPRTVSCFLMRLRKHAGHVTTQATAPGWSSCIAIVPLLLKAQGLPGTGSVVAR
jgi:hypothetical protein